MGGVRPDTGLGPGTYCPWTGYGPVVPKSGQDMHSPAQLDIRTPYTYSGAEPGYFSWGGQNKKYVKIILQNLVI